MSQRLLIHVYVQNNSQHILLNYVLATACIYFLVQS